MGLNTKKILRRILIWLGIPILLIVLFAFIVVAFFGDRVGRMVINSLKEQLKTELTVEKVSMSILPTFPDASVNLTNIHLKDVTGETELLQAGTVSFRIGLWSLFSGNYEIKSVAIEDGEVFVMTDKKGAANYNVFKEKPKNNAPKKEGETVNFSVKKGYISNLKIIYIDEPSKKEIAMRIDDANLAGDFGTDKYSLVSDARLFFGYYASGKDKYLEGKHLSYDATIEIDNKNGLYTFKDVMLEAEKNVFRANGTVQNSGAINIFDMALKGEQCDIGTLLGLLPAGSNSMLGGFESNADLNFVATIKGELSKQKIPEVNVSLGLDDGKITHPRMEGSLKDVSFKIGFTTGTSGRGDDAHFSLSGFRGALDGNPISMGLKMRGLDNPFVDFDFNGKISLKQVYGLLGENVTGGDGLLDVENIRVRGYLDDMLEISRASKVEAGGAVRLTDASLTKNGEEVLIKNGRMALEGNDFHISELSFDGAGSQFLLNGNFYNLLPVLLADSANTQNAKLEFEALLYSQKVDLDRLLKFLNSDGEDDPKTTKNESGGTSIVSMMSGTFNAKIGELKYKKFTAKDFSGTLEFFDESMRVKNVKVNALGGFLQLNALAKFGERPSLEAYIDALSVDMSRTLAEWDNFGQKTITDKNLKGSLTAHVLLRAFWDEKGKFLDDKLYALADVNLQNGELIGVEMMKQFSKFAKVQDLEHMVFSSLRNQFEIKDRVFIMPAMFIQTNALNLTVAGRQDFDQNFDYYFKVNAGQVIMDKFKRFNPNLQPKKAKKNGLFNVYVHVFGNSAQGKYDWKMDKKGVQEVIKADEQRRFAGIQNTLTDEFVGVKALEEPDDMEDVPEYGQGKFDYDDKGKEQEDKFMWDK